MIEQSSKKIEKRARLLLSMKDIPPDKMDIVNSLLFNISLSKQEKFSAVIDIIKSCPDKKVNRQKEIKHEVPGKPEINKIKLDENSQFVNKLYLKYKPLKLFKKRYLIHANNKLGMGFRKRLIPGRKLIKILWDIFSFQEKIMSRLPEILVSILKDENIDDATQFNYLRIFRRWMMETPIIKYDMYEIKWMSISHLESELHSYVVNYLAFLKMDSESRQQILLAAENKLRLMDDLIKEDIFPDDSQGEKAEKEKMNYKKEKIIFDYMMIMRSFIQPDFNNSKSNIISEHLKSKYNIDSLTDLLIIMLESMVFQRETGINDIVSRYEIRAHKVNPEVWDYNDEFLKEIGKDPESRRKKFIRKLKEELIPYDELFSFLKLRIDGQLVLQSAVEIQWKVADKRQRDFNNLYNDDFLSFIDQCVNYFNNLYTPFLNGSQLTFMTKEGSSIEGSVFNASLFVNELSLISDLLGELNEFKTSNPRLTVSREDVVKIMQGKIRSMFEVERFVTLIGDVFYEIGDKLHTIYEKHRLWAMQNNNEDIKISLNPIKKVPDDKAPVPFYNCRVVDIKDKRLLSDRLINNPVLTDSARGGIIIALNAFSYQLAYECLNDDVYSRLEKRKEITKKINEIGG